MFRMIEYVIAVSLITLASSETAFAYLDPGTGGTLYQMLVLIFGAVVAYFLFGKRIIKGLFKGSKGKDEGKK
ncbi:MAG TPA: hypothetical protein VJM57_05590 [Thermodesulfobacteriota bacterium]|nr:hypothetical protein [Thermodesulfobacteriota bacterium]